MSRYAVAAGILAIVVVAVASHAARASIRDASIAPPPGYVLQEAVAVPVSGAAGVTSRKRLVAGKTYLLRVTGTFFTGEGAGPGYGDAEYVFTPVGAHVIDACRSGVDLGVGIDDANIAPGHGKTPHWGPYHRTHVYTLRYRGAGARIRVDYHDCFYGDNRATAHQSGTGPLILDIYRPV